MAIRDTARRKLTYQDYLLFPEDGNRHEILDGEHVVTPAPFLRHQRISFLLTLQLGSFVEERRLGQLYTAPTDVLLSVHDIVQPDLLFVTRERLEILTGRNVQGALDLVIEILSDSTRGIDEGTKRERYEVFGVQEYWVVDPAKDTIRIHRRFGNRLRLSMELTSGDVLSTPLLPGLTLPLSKIFSE